MVQVYCDPGDLLADAAIRAVTRAVSAAAAFLESEESVAFGDVTVMIVDADRISALHAEYFNDPAPTDVITFPGEPDPDNDVLNGDIAICIDEARDQAAEAEHGLHEEIVFLALHGLLHLCGWDDLTVDGRTQMIERQNELLERVGVGTGAGP